MHVSREWMHRLSAKLGPGRLDDDLEAEPRLHRELAGQKARRRGVDCEGVLRVERIKAGGAP